MTVYVFEKAAESTDELIKRAVLYTLREANAKIPADLSVMHTEHGKPYLSIPHMFVSASHTDNLALIAVNGSEVGIDIENSLRKIENREKIADKFFSPWEKNYVFSKKDGVSERFLEIWVKKEAYYKFLGGGEYSPDTFAARGTFVPIHIDGYTAFAYSELICLNCINVKRM